jgi:hypothetical protein
MHFHLVTNTFGKMFCRCRVIDRFCERSDWAFSILGCPYFVGYYSGLLKVFLKTFYRVWYPVVLCDDIIVIFLKTISSLNLHSKSYVLIKTLSLYKNTSFRSKELPSFFL